MSPAQLRASLALWRSRYAYRLAREKFWSALHNRAGVNKWQKLREEAKAKIHQRLKELGQEHPPTPKPPGPFKPRFGIDYSEGRPSIARLKAAGVSFVCRYLAEQGNPKNLSRQEALILSHAGLDIVAVWETTANRALSGYNAGTQDARAAVAQLKAIGAPGDAVVYFAVDFEDKDEPVGDYFRGVGSVIGKRRTGVYGGIAPVHRLMAANLCAYGWQTYAWSGGEWEPDAQLRQFSNDHELAGVSCDFDRAVKPSFGQWRVK